MDFLRFLLRLPFTILTIVWEACLYFILFLSILLRGLLWLLSPFIGKVNWSIPKWYPKAKSIASQLGEKLTKHGTIIGSMILILLVVGLSGNYAYHWYLNRPKPIDPAPIIINSYGANFYSPSYSDSVLEISFVGNYRSPAPLELVGKTITEGVTISPTIDGVWRWKSDKSIEFKPNDKWPLGVEYTVNLDSDKLFSKDNLLAKNSRKFTFISQNFSYAIANEEFYEDPTHPENKMAIFTINFSHPVNKSVFEKAISLGLYLDAEVPGDDGKFIKQYGFNVTYDDNKNTAYIKSAPLSLPDEAGYLALSIEKGIVSTLGGSKSSSLKKSYVGIPGRFNLFVNVIEVDLIEVNNQQMRQILSVNLNHNVKASDLNKVIKVWQLPQNDKKSYSVRYYDNLDHQYKTKLDVTKADLAKSKQLTLKMIETETPYQQQINFEVNAAQSSSLYITIDKPLVSDGSYYLAAPFQQIVVVPQFPALMNFAADGSLLSLSGEHKLSIVSRNMANVKLEIERVIPSQLQHLVAFNDSYYYDNMNFGDLSSDHFIEKYSVTKQIKGAAEAVTYSDIDLSQYLKKDVTGEEIRGVFLVKLYGNHQQSKKDEFDYYRSRFIVVTDLGIINKKSLDQSQDIFVQSIRTGEPVTDAKVSVLGVNGIEIASEKTDSEGHVHFGPLSDYYQGIKPLIFVVEKDHDLSFLPIRSYDRQLNFSRFDIGGIYETVDGGELRTHLFSDRGIYRPGDTFNIGMIIRAQDWSKSLAGIQLEADIYDPKSNKVQTKSFTLDQFGFNEFSYKTDYTSPTGEWFINIYLKNPNDRNRTLLGSTSVMLREFEPDKTAVTLTLLSETLPVNQAGWIHPDKLSAIVEAKNLFGTPAQNRRVASKLILEPSAPYFKAYDNYAFYQNIRHYQNSFNIAIEEVETDENGQAELSLPIGQFEGNYTAKILTDVFEPESGRSVAATASVFISPNDYLVGAKPDGRLDYIKRDATRKIELIAINSQLEKIDLSDLILVKLEQRYLSVLVKQPSGVYKYESKRKDTVLSETPFTINRNKTIYDIDSEMPGNFILQLKKRDGDVVFQTSYSIAGTANVSRTLDRNAELVLKINNNQYKAGDEIEVSITAPYIGSGIITIERDKVYAWKWFKTDTTSSVQKITLPDGIDGNAYINVQFVRDPSSDEIFMSPLSYGVIPFKINNDKFNDHIKLTAPEQIKPGQTLPITIETNSQQRVIVFAIDEGILQVSGYQLQNPLNNFLRKKALSVSTAQILDLILPEYSRLLNLSAPGGDADERNASLAAHLNPFKRKVDAPVAYWSGIIDVNKSKTVEYRVPDYFNGKIRIMAVSVGKQTMGSTQTSTTVRDEFVLNPNIPYFVAPGDEFEISLSVANNLEDIEDKVVPIEISLETTPHLTIIDEKVKYIDLASMHEGVVQYKLKATDQLGSGDLSFKATYGDKVVTRKISTSVRPASQYRLQTTMGRMDSNSQTVSGFRDMYAPFSQRNAAVSYSPFVLTKGLATYLQDYPHYCSEQIISQAVPVLLASKYSAVELSNSNQTTSINQLLQTLQTRQNSDGAIGLWYSTYNVDPFVTLYTVQFLLEAKDAGHIVPHKMLKLANEYLRQVANSEPNDEYGLRLRAYAIYLLTRQSEITTSYIASIMKDLNRRTVDQSWQHDLTALYLASSYKMLKMDKEADKLLKPVWKQLATAYNSAWWSNSYYDPLVIDAGKIYLISKHFPNKVKDIPAQALENMVLMLNQSRYTTQSSAATILALDSYVSAINTGALTPDDLTITAKSRDTNKQEIMRTIGQLQGLLAKGKFNANDIQITYHNQTDLPAWYVLSTQGFDNTDQQESISKGFEIYREFTDDKNQIVSQVKQGDKVNVTIRLNVLSNQAMTNLAIIDLLPGGFEVVQQPVNQYDEESDDDDDDYYYEDEGYDSWWSSIAYGDNSWYPEYTDVREDRVLIYGVPNNDGVQSFTYQIKATNVGEYSVPPIYGEAMYDRDIQAVSKGGDKITVVPN